MKRIVKLSELSSEQRALVLWLLRTRNRAATARTETVKAA